MINKPTLLFNPQMPNLQDNKGMPSDTVPPKDRGDLTNLDETKLLSHLQLNFRNHIQDKVEYGWDSQRIYDIQSYYMVKNAAMMNFPYKGASAFRVPMTPTFVDTAVANIKASIWSDDGKAVRVKGQGPEDKRTAPILESYMNFKVNNEIDDMEAEIDATIFGSVLHGVKFLKVIKDFKNNIKVSSVDAENCFLAVDCRGVQANKCDMFTQIIPLTKNDLEARRKFYRNVDMIQPGIGIANARNESIITERDKVSGTGMVQRLNRECYYIAETYVTYYPGVGMKPLELIVWWNPNGMGIQRIRPNVDGFRPYADFHCYPLSDRRFWSLGLPQKVKPVQEELDYANKQNTDSLDKQISPAMFIDHTDEFDPGLDQRKPSGVYKIGRNNNVRYEQMPQREVGFERRAVDLWQQGERLTGLFDISQGAMSRAERTLGETQITIGRSDVRFSSILDRFESSYAQGIELIYEYANRYEDRSKKLKIVGFQDIMTIDEIFPNPQVAQGLGLAGSFDFSFGGASQQKREIEKQEKINFCTNMFPNPMAQDKATAWRLGKLFAEAQGIDNYEMIFPKPKEVDLYNAQEFIERVMSGQVNLQLRPGIDADNYVFEMQLFMQTETFHSLDQKSQMAIVNALRRAYMMSVAEKAAMTDMMTFQQHIQGQGMLPQPGMGNPQPNMPQIGMPNPISKPGVLH